MKKLNTKDNANPDNVASIDLEGLADESQWSLIADSADDVDMLIDMLTSVQEHAEETEDARAGEIKNYVEAVKTMAEPETEVLE